MELDYFERVGSVVEFVFLDRGREELSDITLHANAAEAGMREIARRVDEWHVKNAPVRKLHNISDENLFRVEFEFEKARSNMTSVEAFLGSGYRIGGLNLSFGSATYNKVGGDWVLAPDPTFGPSDWKSGFTYALLDPPYGLGMGKGNETAAHFERLLLTMFEEFKVSWEIREWSHDWSNFFEAGSDWWGCFFWTMASISRPYVLAIGASSTD